jgi:uncharacterized membrane protein YgcG
LLLFLNVQLQEAREEAALLRATQSRLTTAADDAAAEKAYLLAERSLMVAQLRNLALLLAADAAGCNGCSGAASAVGVSSSGGGGKSSGGRALRAAGFLGLCAGEGASKHASSEWINSQYASS